MSNLINPYVYGGIRSAALMLADLQSIRNTSAFITGINWRGDAFYDQSNVDLIASLNENYVARSPDRTVMVSGGDNALTVEDGNPSSWTWVVVIPAGSIMKSGNSIRLKLAPSLVNGATMVAYFGQSAAVNEYAFLAGNKVQITYNGSTSMVFPPGTQEVWSDPIPYTFDSTKKHTFAVSLSTGYTMRNSIVGVNPNGWIPYEKNSTNDAVTDAKTGYGSSSYLKVLSAVAVVEADLPVPATSYANSGGTGNRTGSITVTSTVVWDSGTLANLVDGTQTNNMDYPNANASAGQYIRFDFGSGVKKYISEIRAYSVHAGTGGTFGRWKWQGSDNASTWVDISPSFEWLADTRTSIFGNINPPSAGFRYYQIVAITPLFANDFVNEFEFRIADGAVVNLSREFYEGTNNPNNQFSLTLGSQNNYANDNTIRQLISGGQISMSGSRCAVEFKAHPSYPLVIKEAWIQQQSSTYQFTANPIPLRFGGEYGVRIPANTVLACDPLDFGIVAGTPYIVSYVIGDTIYINHSTATSGFVAYYKATYDPIALSTSGFSTYQANGSVGVTKLIVYNPNNLDLRSKSFTATYIPNEARVMAFIILNEAATIDTDYELYATRDDGVTWVEVTGYVSGGSAGVSGSWIYIHGLASFAGQPSGSTIRGGIRIKNNKNIIAGALEVAV